MTNDSPYVEQPKIDPQNAQARPGERAPEPESREEMPKLTSISAIIEDEQVRRATYRHTGMAPNEYRAQRRRLIECERQLEAMAPTAATRMHLAEVRKLLGKSDPPQTVIAREPQLEARAVISQLRDLESRIGPARTPESIREEIRAMANQFAVWRPEAATPQISPESPLITRWLLSALKLVLDHDNDAVRVDARRAIASAESALAGLPAEPAITAISPETALELMVACEKADSLIENLWKAVDWGKTFDLDIQALNEAPIAIKKALAHAKRDLEGRMDGRRIHSNEF